jgi:aldehyde:ferredoxin oxidoreductase
MFALHEASGVLLAWLNCDNTGGYMSSEVVRNIAIRYWGGEAAADYTTWEGKPLAAKMTQDRTSAMESLVLCNARWPLHTAATADHLMDPDLPASIFSAVTGREIDRVELDRIGERIFNLQRIVLLRDGWGGRRGDKLLDYHHDQPLLFTRFDRECEVPGKDGAVGSRKGIVIDRGEFEKLKDEFYGLRGWDIYTGTPTAETLRSLKLDDLAGELEKADRAGPDRPFPISR